MSNEHLTGINISLGWIGMFLFFIALAQCGKSCDLPQKVECNCSCPQK